MDGIVKIGVPNTSASSARTFGTGEATALHSDSLLNLIAVTQRMGVKGE